MTLWLHKEVSVHPELTEIILIFLRRCMPNGESNVVVILRLGPGVSSESIHALRNKMKMNDGELELSNRATVRLTAIEIVKPGKLTHDIYFSVLN